MYSKPFSLSPSLHLKSKGKEQNSINSKTNFNRNRKEPGIQDNWQTVLGRCQVPSITQTKHAHTGLWSPKAWKPTTHRQKQEDQKFKATLRYLQFEACLEIEEEREGRRGGYLPRVHQNLEHRKTNLKEPDLTFKGHKLWGRDKA